MGTAPGAFSGGQLGTQDYNGVEISAKPWNSGICNLANSPLLAPDTGVNPTPQNDSSVADNDVPSSIEAGDVYVQPGTQNPLDNSQIDVSSAGGAIPVSEIQVEEGSNYTQPNDFTPAPNPQIGVPVKNLNPMGL